MRQNHFKFHIDLAKNHQVTLARFKDFTDIRWENNQQKAPKRTSPSWYVAG